jgi:hypothetical protein
VQIENCGSIFLFTLLTQEAEDWVRENVGESMFFGESLTVEHRYAWDIAQGMIADGLIVE